jgi:hypothetical protein
METTPEVIAHTIYSAAHKAYFANDSVKPWNTDKTLAFEFDTEKEAEEYIVRMLGGLVGTDAKNFRMAYVVPLTDG